VAGNESASARTVARVVVALVFSWHGLVPKLLLRADDESLMLTDAGLGRARADALVAAAGVAELAWAILLLTLGRRHRWPWFATIALMALLTAALAFTSPRYFALPFNPLTLDLCVAALSWIALPARGERAKK
jgi:hypothetical protein